MGGVDWGRTSNRRGNLAGSGRIDAHDRIDRIADGRAAYTPFPNYEETVDGANTTTRATYSLAGQATAVHRKRRPGLGGVGWDRTSNRWGNLAGNGRIDAHDRIDRMGDGRVAYTVFLHPGNNENIIEMGADLAGDAWIGRIGEKLAQEIASEIGEKTTEVFMTGLSIYKDLSDMDRASRRDQFEHELAVAMSQQEPFQILVAWEEQTVNIAFVGSNDEIVFLAMTSSQYIQEIESAFWDVLK